MKKTTLLILATTLTLLALLSSCLGDSGSKGNVSQSLGYVKISEQTGRKIALTATSGMISVDALSGVYPGNMYYFDFHWNSKFGTSEPNVMNVEDLRLSGDRKALEQTAITFPELDENGKVVLPGVDELVLPSNMELYLYSPYVEQLEDRWVFVVTHKTKEDDKFRLVAYFDKSAAGQSEIVNKEVLPIDNSKGQFMIDLRLERYKKDETSTEEEVITKSYVVNLSQLRYYIQNNYLSEEKNPITEKYEKERQFRFRYITKEGKDKEEEDKYIGTWSGDRKIEVIM